MNASRQFKASPKCLSGMLFAFSALWFVSAYVFYLKNRSSKDGVFGAPVWDLMFVTIAPFTALWFGPWLIIARRGAGQRLRLIDYCALIAGLAPFSYVGILLLIFFAGR